jgi:transposase
MAHPDWVLAFRQKNQEVKKIQNKYYLYEVSSYYDKVKKKTVKKSGKYLGRITQDGLVNNENKETFAVARVVSVKEFGASDLILSCLSKEQEVLGRFFPHQAQQLLCSVVFRLLYQSSFKQMLWHLESSYLSERYAEVNMGSRAMTELLQTVGNQREHIASVMRELCGGAEILLIDSTHITTQSGQNLSAQVGYNSQRNFDTQINLLYLFSQDTQMPVFYRCVQGSVREVRSFRLTLQESGIKQAVLVSDKGFYSQNNVSILEEDKWQYVLPLRRKSVLLNYSCTQSGNKKEFDGFFIFEARVIWYKVMPLTQENMPHKQVILFLDEALKLTESKDYLQRMTDGTNGYTMAGFYEKEVHFGTLGFITNTTEIQQVEIIEVETEIIESKPITNNEPQNDLKETKKETKKEKEKKFEAKEVALSPQKVYQYYKSRNDIEQLNDVYKNVLEADKTYMQSEAGMEAWHFINFFALRAYYRILAQLKETDLNKKYSPADILLVLQNVKKVKINDTWVEAEIPKRAKIVIDAFNLKKTPVT